MACSWLSVTMFSAGGDDASPDASSSLAMMVNYMTLDG